MKNTYETGINLFGCEVMLYIKAKTTKQQLRKRDRVIKWFDKIFDSLSPIKNTCESKEAELSRERQAVRAMVKAFEELNTIRARDGVPWTSYLCKASVDIDYFSSVVDELDEAVQAITGKSAHCHSELYAPDDEI